MTERAEATRWPSTLAAAIPSVALVASLFLPWFGVSVGQVGLSVDGLSAHRFLYVALALALLELAYLSATARRPGPARGVLMTIDLVDVVLVAVAFVDKPVGGRLVGAYLGLVGAVGACALTLALRRSDGAANR